jgi:hypothetical protein
MTQMTKMNQMNQMVHSQICGTLLTCVPEVGKDRDSSEQQCSKHCYYVDRSQPSIMDGLYRRLHGYSQEMGKYFHKQSLEYLTIMEKVKPSLCPNQSELNQEGVKFRTNLYLNLSYGKENNCLVEPKKTRKTKIVTHLKKNGINDPEVGMFFVIDCLTDCDKGRTTELDFYQFVSNFCWKRTIEVYRRYNLGTYSVDLTHIWNVVKKDSIPHHLRNIFLFHVDLVIDVKGNNYLNFTQVTYNHSGKKPSPIARPLEILYGRGNTRYVSVEDFINQSKHISTGHENNQHFLFKLARQLPNKRRLYRNRHYVYFKDDLPTLLSLHEPDLIFQK